MNLPLFDAPAPLRPLIPESREERLAVLDALPNGSAPLANQPKNIPRIFTPRVARAICDPVGHLHTCLDPACPDCAALIEQGFQQCGNPTCARWSHSSCQYRSHEDPEIFICTTCMIAEGRPLDGRERRYEWTPPAALLREAV